MSKNKKLVLLYNFLFTNKTKMLTIRVIILSLVYHLILKYVPPKHYEKMLGKRGVESEVEIDRADEIKAYWIGVRIERVCDKTPWESKCFVRAMIAQHILSRKHLPTTLYMGVENKNKRMTAHAWLRCGTVFVVGGYGKEYVVTAKFCK